MSCYDCQHHLLCSFRRQLDETLRGHLDFVDVNEGGSDNPKNWQQMFKAVAGFCTHFEKSQS